MGVTRQLDRRRPSSGWRNPGGIAQHSIAEAAHSGSGDYCGNTFGATTRFLLSPSTEKDVVHDGIPGVMNADQEQQEHRSSNPNRASCTCGLAASADATNVPYAA